MRPRACATDRVWRVRRKRENALVVLGAHTAAGTAEACCSSRLIYAQRRCVGTQTCDHFSHRLLPAASVYATGNPVPFTASRREQHFILGKHYRTRRQSSVALVVEYTLLSLKFYTNTRIHTPLTQT